MIVINSYSHPMFSRRSWQWDDPVGADKPNQEQASLTCINHGGRCCERVLSE